MILLINNIMNNEDIKILIYSLIALGLIIFVILFFQILRILFHTNHQKHEAWDSIVSNIVESNQNNPKNISKIMNHKTNWDYEYSGLKKIQNLEIKTGKHITDKEHQKVKDIKQESIKLFKKFQSANIFESEIEEQISKASTKKIIHKSAKEENFAKELTDLEESINNLKTNNKLPKKEQTKIKELIKHE